jgi:hypothetical protein
LTFFKNHVSSQLLTQAGFGQVDGLAMAPPFFLRFFRLLDRSKRFPECAKNPTKERRGSSGTNETSGLLDS